MNGRIRVETVESPRTLSPRQVKAVLEFHQPDPIELRQTVEDVERIERELRTERELGGGETT